MTAAGPQGVRDLWMRVRLDGHEHLLLVRGSDARDGRAELLATWLRGRTVHHQAASGELVVNWGRVATLQVFEVVRQGPR